MSKQMNDTIICNDRHLEERKRKENDKKYQQVCHCEESQFLDHNEYIKTISNSSIINFEVISREWLYSKKHELKTSSYAKYNNMLTLYLLP